MKIALLTNGIFPFNIGGIQKHTYFLAKNFAKEKITVDIYHPGLTLEETIKIEDYFEIKELLYLNFIVIPFPKVAKFPGHYIYASYLYSKELFKKVRKKELSLIYAQGFTSWYFLRQNPFQNNLISNLHGLEMFQSSINFKNRLEQVLLKIPAKTIIKNSNIQVSLGGKLTDILYQNGAEPNSVVEIPNGIDTSWVLNIHNLDKTNSINKMKFVFVGRYERRKGIEEFQEVIQKTIDTLDYEVVFIGPIPIEKQIKHPQVNYLGSIKDSEIIKTQLHKADILVCPSYSEGMPTVILEAMACGCAIIATDVGAVNTMVNHQNGWLITGNIVPGLLAAMKEAVNNTPGELTLKKQYSIDKVKNNFTWEQVIQKTIKAIKI